MEIDKKQKEKLRKLLEKISTPEEMKAFDVELLSKNNEESTKKILDKIEESKPEIKWDFVQNIINRTEKIITEKLEELKNDFDSKKYPTYDDSILKEKIDGIKSEMEEHQMIREAREKHQKMMLDELVNIGDVLIQIKELSNKSFPDKKLDTLNESLEGIGGLLLKILSKTGSNDSFRIKDSSGNIVNVASESQNIYEYNLEITTANTEYSQSLPDNTRMFEFRNRDLYDVRYSFTSGKVATPTSPYQTLRAGMSAHEDKLNFIGKTIYFASSQPNQVIEMLIFT